MEGTRTTTGGGAVFIRWLLGVGGGVGWKVELMGRQKRIGVPQYQ